MDTAYNAIAGKSAERRTALSDGGFAVAMMMLALDLRAPAVEAIHGGHISGAPRFKPPTIVGGADQC